MHFLQHTGHHLVTNSKDVTSKSTTQDAPERLPSPAGLSNLSVGRRRRKKWCSCLLPTTSYLPLAPGLCPQTFSSWEQLVLYLQRGRVQTLWAGQRLQVSGWSTWNSRTAWPLAKVARKAEQVADSGARWDWERCRREVSSWSNQQYSPLGLWCPSNSLYLILDQVGC
jgi:hypothetical protein